MAKAAALPTLPARLTRVDASAGAQIPVAAGYHALWVPYYPEQVGLYQRRGVHLAKAGEGFVEHEHLYEQTPEGYLKRGDAVIGIVTEDAYQAELADQQAEWARKLGEGGGTLVKSKRPIREKSVVGG